MLAIAVPVLAAPGDPDPGFGTNGVFELATGDRYQAVDAPLIQPSGRIIFAGLLKNASDRVFLAASTPGGTLDTTFGSGGEVHTNSVAPSRMAATALAPDGKVLVAGGSTNNGTVTIERFTANGAKDNTWGSSGRVTVNLGGAYARPTGMVAVGTTHVLVIAENASGNRNVFTVAKVGTSGFDTTFGTGGIARVAFPSNRAATAYDLAVLPTGKILLAGKSQGSNVASADTSFARLNANGSIDSTFGSGGQITHSIATGNAEDYATALAPLADGRFLATGPAAGVGMVSRFAANGALDATFGTGGKVVGGLTAAGSTFAPADVMVDADGRVLLTGTQTQSGTSNWAILRLKANASPTVLDDTFGTGGRVVPTACANTVAAGPTGFTLDGDRILVLGACENTARTSLIRLLGGGPSGPPFGPVTLSVNPDTEAAGHARIPLSNLDASAIPEAAEDVTASALRHNALRHNALRHNAMATVALRHNTLGQLGIVELALRHNALRHNLLSEIALRHNTWENLLPTEAPLQTLTFGDAAAINPGAVGALTLEDIDLSSTALRHNSLGAFVLGKRPLSAVPAPDGGWCSFLASQPFNCSNGVSESTTTLLDLELAGDDLSAYYESPISLLDVDLGSGADAAPIAGFLLREMNLNIDPFKNAEASEFASILNCGTCAGRKLGGLTPTERGNATVGQLVGLLPKPSLQDVALGDVLLALLDPTEVPYENLDLEGLLNEAEFRSDDLVTYTASFELDCSQAADVKATFTAPGDARPVPGGATLALDGGAPVALDNGKPADGKKGPFEFALAPGCAGQTGRHAATLRIVVEPGSVLGPIEGAKIELSGSGSNEESDELTTTVDDSRDQGDELTDVRPIAEDALLTGHLSSSDDIDSFSFTPGAGRTTISLSHLPADYDLVIYGPEIGPDTSALRHNALRHNALRHNPVEDSSEEPADDAIVAPDQIQDIALRHNALRHNELALRASSINRQATSEAASVVVRPEEAGALFTAEVIGYNGTFDADPYVVRRTDTPAAPVPACPTRSLSSGFSIPYPGDAAIANDARALYLVAPGRMAARDGQAPTQAAMDKLQELAGETNGVVVNVENNPDVATGGAFSAWDANPCSPEAANEVVSQINSVVDDLRAGNGGLPELRSIVLVGPDEVLPQARIQDKTAIGNQSDYADDATVDRNGDGVRDDNAVSAAFRNGFMLSDDPFGDFDPAGTVFTPDVALGRLVETPAQVQAQAQAFIDAEGRVQPQRSFVTGYDFLSDGANDVFDALSAATPSNSSRIDETWTAADAAAGLNAPGAGFLSVNAHYDHYRALPADAFNGSSPNLLNASQTNAPAGSVVFTVGCQSGLNLAVGDASSASDPRLGDWAERMVTRGALYAANTGFGYGDDAAVAYSERIMADYAEGLTSGNVTAGQALMIAKHNAFAAVGVSDVYWTKAAMEATFYGLPMYKVGADGAEGPATLPPSPTGVDPSDPSTPSSASLSVDPSDPSTRSSTPLSVDLRDRFEQITDERGTFFNIVGEEPLVVLRRPIQPKLSQDVTSPDGPAHGFLLESLTTSDTSGVDPAIARPTVDLAEHEPEPDSDAPFFPATFATVESQATELGRRDLLTLMAGSFRGDIQRLNLELGGRVLRSTSDDYEPPIIRRVDGLVANGNFSVRVEAEGDDILGGNMLYITDADKAGGGEVEWHRANLSMISPGILATGGPLPSGTEIAEAVVQVYDTSYNNAFSDFKVEGHTIVPVPPSGPGDPRVVYNPGTPASGYFSAPPQVDLDEGDHADATFEYSVDGSEFQEFTGPFTVDEPAEGEHLVVFRGSDGSATISRFAVDREGPTIVAEADRPANANGWYDGPVTFTFTCGDGVSGVATCPDPVTFSASGANQSVARSATDRAGNSSSLTVGPVNIDQSGPTISAQTLTQPNQFGWYTTAGVTVRFTCADDVGLTKCGDNTLSGTPKNATDDVVFTQEGRNQVVSGEAVDQAGNSATAQAPPVNIDRTAPNVAITTTGGVLIGNQRLQGTAFDATSGVRLVQITYKRTTGNNTTVRDATLTCQPNGQCTWEATLPSIGFWEATARATDFAGNVSPPSNKVLITVR